MVAAFEYDALGRRIEKVDPIAGTTTRYDDDDQRVILRTAVSGGVETDMQYYVFGNTIDEALMVHNLTGPNTGDFYYGHDPLFSPAALFNAAGSGVERYEYDACGILGQLQAFR